MPANEVKGELEELDHGSAIGWGRYCSGSGSVLTPAHLAAAASQSYFTTLICTKNFNDILQASDNTVTRLFAAHCNLALRVGNTQEQMQ